MRSIVIGSIVALCALACATSVKAQADGPTFSLSSGTCPGTGCQTIVAQGRGSIGVQVSGNLSGTIQFEQSIDSTNWVAWSVTPAIGGSSVTSTTGTGFWIGAVNGVGYVRLRVSSFSSGTANVTTQSSQARIGVSPGAMATFASVTADSIVMDRINQDVHCYRSAAKTLTCDADGAGGALTLTSIKGVLTISDSITSQSNITATGGVYPGSSAQGLLQSSGAGIFNFLQNSGGGPGFRIDGSTAGTAWFLGSAAGADTATVKANTFVSTGAYASVGGVATAGSFGVDPVVATYETTGNTGAVASAINYTPAAVASTYEMTGVVNVTAWTTPATFTVAVSYRDASGTARTDTAMVVRGTGASAAAVTAVDRWYFSFPAIDINNAGTAITLSTTGTFTGSPVYNLEGHLRRIR